MVYLQNDDGIIDNYVSIINKRFIMMIGHAKQRKPAQVLILSKQSSLVLVNIEFYSSQQKKTIE